MMRVYFAIFLLFFSTSALALPASARLFQQKYGYRVSCMLCHTDGGGSAPNEYGKAFLRAGANLNAFQKIEAMDSDGDGFKNLAEILAKSNPGQKASTPTALGDWLANVGGVQIPQKELEKLFPGFSKFSALEGQLKPEQVEFLKSKLGHDPSDDDRVPTFYFAERDGKKQAVAQFVSERDESQRSLTTAVAVSTAGKVTNVLVLGGSLAKEAPEDSGFLKSYLDKSFETLPSEAPAQGAQKLIYSSVKRSLTLMQAVFSGGAKK